MPSQKRGQLRRGNAVDGLRVALVSEYYYPDVGGMPEHVHQLGRALQRRGHDVTLITTEFPGRVDLPGDTPYEVVRLGRACPPLYANGSLSLAAVGLGLRRRITQLFHERAFDIIHVHAPIFPTLALLAIACAPPDSTLMGTLHTHFVDSAMLRLFRPALQRYLDALDGLIAVSDTAIDCMRRIGFRLDAEVIPNGVDIDAWQSGVACPSLRGEASFHLLVQARLEPRNRIETVIDGLKLLSSDGLPRRLTVLGEGPRRNELTALARGCDVCFPGAVVAARPDYAASTDVYCFTADIASHPMSLIEGMAAGLPVIAHPIAGVSELVTDGVDGLLVPVGDMRAYAQALRTLQTSDSLRRQLGEAARAKVWPLDWSRLVVRIEEQYLRAQAIRIGGASVAREPATVWT